MTLHMERFAKWSNSTSLGKNRRLLVYTLQI
jgi:hypothetical protein